MSTVWIVVLVLVAAAASIAVLLLRSRKQKERQQYYEAAQRIVQEEYLNSALRNVPLDENLSIAKTMICLKEEKKKGGGFVFDPEQVVNVGRNRSKNEICLPDATVSGWHMRIFMYGGQIYGEDLNSSNGTGVKHKREPVRWLKGEMEALDSGDRIYVGNICLRLTVFVCDVAAI